ncbi:helix-turn-helix domain-containing protein [Nocardia sp. NPDC005825]|uniref:TetR/AcrR family transcriptional regulator n=1 Tax=unclassified Nocardia TaxID=2637762 RepID=UPI00340ACC97
MTEDTLRSDVRRNRRRILDAAADVLAVVPDASMQDLADASGLNRVTLYRHFPNREELLAAMRAAVGADVKACYEQLPKDGPVLDRIIDLIEPFVGLGNRYRALMTAPGWLGSDITATLEVGAPLLAAIERGQHAGEIDASYSPNVVALLFTDAIVNTVLIETAGVLTRDEALRQSTRAFVRAVATHPDRHLELS